MNKAALIISFLVIGINLFAQDSTEVYLNGHYDLTSKDSTVYIRKVVMKNQRICLTDMNADRSRILYCEFKSLNPVLEDGLAIFYKNGDSIYATGKFLSGKMVDKWVYYTKNRPDTVNYTFINKCSENDLNDIESYDSGDEQTRATGERILDSLPGFIKSNFHLPPRAIIDKISYFGRRFNCIIDTTGEIKCPNIKSAIYTDLDLEIYRILSLYKYKDEIKNPFRLYSVPFSYGAGAPAESDTDEVFVVVEEMPSFPGGDVAMLKFISKNLKYPIDAFKNKIQGNVILRFCVTKDGTVDKITVVRGVDPALDAEAVRVLSLLPQFKPGRQEGKPVNVWYSMPISFRIR